MVITVNANLLHFYVARRYVTLPILGKIFNLMYLTELLFPIIF